MTLYDRQTLKTTASMPKRDRFASIGNNLESIAQLFHRDDELVKLLVRNTATLGGEGKVTNKERAIALTESIVTVPLIDKDSDLKTYLIMQPVQGMPFGNHGDSTTKLVIAFDVICNFDVWKLKSNESRPLAIMNRIDKLLGETKLDTFGSFEFMGFNSMLVDERHGGFHMEYLYGQE